MTTRSSQFAVPLALGLLLPSVVLLAILLALAPLIAALFVVSVVSVILALALPLSWMLILTLAMAALVSGSAEYFMGLSQANWLPFVLSSVVAARALVQAKLQPQEFGATRSSGLGPALFVYPAILYLTILVASAAANAVPAAQALAAFKNYTLMWGVLVCVYYLDSVERTSTLMWRLIVLTSLLQLPVVLYQRFFVASRLGNSASSLSYDAINGTFGGGLTGGRSGALALFICAGWAYLLILWRDRQLKLGWLALLSLFLLASLFVAEVKVVIIWLPLVGLLVFFARIRDRPILFVLGLIGSTCLALAIIAAYRVSYASPTADTSLEHFFTRDLAYVFDPNRFNPATRELGRVSALVHWWRELGSAGIGQLLVGYGPGASRGVSSVAIGTIAKRYPFSLDISAAAGLLWDTGLLGLIAFCSMVGLGAIESKRLSRLRELPTSLRQELEAGYVVLVLVLSSVFYVRDAIDGPILQFVVFFALGVVTCGRRIISTSRPSAAPKPGASTRRPGTSIVPARRAS